MPEKIGKKALELMHSGRFSESIQMFQKLLSQSTNGKTRPHISSQKILMYKCAAHLEVGQYQACEQMAKRLLNIDGDLQQAYMYQAISLVLRGNFEESLAICNQRLKFNNRNWKLYFAKAYVLQKMAKFEEALINYSIAITKNILNNPRTYILQAFCFVAQDEGDAARKNMHYASMAMKEQEHKNCQGQYKFQINNIKTGLKCYQVYLKKLNKAQAQFHITKSQRQNLEKQLIKIVSKSVQFGSTAFRDVSRSQYHHILSEIDNYSQEKQLQHDLQVENSDFWNELQIFEEALRFKIRSSFKLKSKQSITSEILTKNEKHSKFDCEWMRQKCCIY